MGLSAAINGWRGLASTGVQTEGRGHPDASLVPCRRAAKRVIPTDTILTINGSTPGIAKAIRTTVSTLQRETGAISRTELSRFHSTQLRPLIRAAGGIDVADADLADLIATPLFSR